MTVSTRRAALSTLAFCDNPASASPSASAVGCRRCGSAASARSSTRTNGFGQPGAVLARRTPLTLHVGGAQLVDRTAFAPDTRPSPGDTARRRRCRRRSIPKPAVRPGPPAPCTTACPPGRRELPAFSSSASRPVPKSIRTIRPPSSRMTFLALTSRCTNPAACTADSARQTSSPTSRRVTRASVPWVSELGFERGAVHELHAQPDAVAVGFDAEHADDVGDAAPSPARVPPCSSRSLSCASATRLCRILIAISRWRSGSHARYTLPKLPSPTFSVRR